MTGISVAICTISNNNFQHQWKLKTFSGFFIAFLEYSSNLERFEKKIGHPSLIITEIIDSKRVGYLNV